MASTAPTAYTPRQRNLTLAAALLGWAFDGMDFLIVVFLARDIGAEFGWTDVEFGAAVLLPMTLATAVGGVVLGAWADRVGRKPALIASILLYSLATAAAAFAPGPLSFIAARIVAGLGVGGEWAIGFALLNEVWGPSSHRRGALGGLTHGFFGVGFLLAAIIASQVGPVFGWRGAFLAAAFPALLVLLIRFGVPESKLWQEYKAAKDKGQLPPALATASARSQLGQVFAPEFRRIVGLATLLSIAGLYAFYLITSWLPTFLRDQGFDPGQVTLVVAAMALIGLPATIAGGALSDRIGRKATFLVFSAFGIVAMSIFIFAITTAQGLVVPALLLFSASLGYFGVYGAWFGELFPTRIRASGPAFAFNVGRGMVAFAGVLVPALASRFGLGGGMAVALLAFVAMALLARAMPETKGRALDAQGAPEEGVRTPRSAVIAELA
jgi:MFS family permease